MCVGAGGLALCSGTLLTSVSDMTVVDLFISVPLCLLSSPPIFLFMCRQLCFSVPAPLHFVLLLFNVCWSQLVLHSLWNKAIPKMKVYLWAVYYSQYCSYIRQNVFTNNWFPSVCLEASVLIFGYIDKSRHVFLLTLNNTKWQWGTKKPINCHFLKL